MGRTIEQVAQQRRDASEMALGIVDESILSDADLAGFQDWRNPLHECDWESLQDDIGNCGKVGIFACESGQADALRTVLLYELGCYGIEFNYQPGKGRMLVRKKPEPAAQLARVPITASPAGSGVSTGALSALNAGMARDVLALLYDAPLDYLRHVVPVLATHAAVIAAPIADDADRDSLLTVARDALCRMTFLNLMTARDVVRRGLAELDADDDGEGFEFEAA